MNKTIFRIDYKISMIIVMVLGVVIGFVSNAYNVDGFMSLIFHFIKLIVLTFIYLGLYLIENKNIEFKDKLKYVFGDLVLLSSLNFICSIFTTAHILAYMFLTFSGVISLYVIVSFTMEILNLYFKNEVINKVISLNKKIGLAIANPIIKSIEKITND
jgi:hypothetical protein